ncbi:MAG: hypothetical protein MRERV_41c005 [Mycoplasmataceae bacterium RV_VA103A]|nr:MAG: hypothetical protein MRERV_41c005 [Mycoplasmataceae bacterium RV_VA103A]
MRYRVFWTEEAKKSLKGIGDREIAEKIENRVENHLASHPTQNGYELEHQWKGFWGYRIDDYRVIYEIVYKIKKKEREIEIIVVEVGERNARQPDSIYSRTPPRPTSKNRITERPKARDLKRKVGK